MATQHGRLEEFHPESDSIKAYLELVTLYFTANAVDNGKRVAVLLSSIGAPTYSLLSDLVAPHLPSTKSFDEISEALRNHYEPKRAIIAERFHFHKRDQAAGETIAEFDAALRKLATHCLFGGALEDTLRDRFVCGLRHESIQRRLLSEKDLKYRDALGIARAMETADRNTKSLKSIPNLRFANLPATLPATLPEFGKRTAATVAVVQTIRQLNVNSKTSNAITAGKKGILHQRVGRRRSPYSRHTLCLNPQSLPRAEAEARRITGELTMSTKKLKHPFQILMQAVGRVITCTSCMTALPTPSTCRYL